MTSDTRKPPVESYPASAGGEAGDGLTRWYLGCGLPASLTAERIAEVLELTRQNERQFQDRLDERGGYFWTATEAEPDFYERMRELLRTAGGRLEYEAARQDLRRKSPKAFGKLEFGYRLMWRCLVDVGREPEDAAGPGRDFDAGDVFGESENLDLKAQFFWGSALAAAESRPWAVGALISDAPEEGMRAVREGLVPASSVVDLSDSGRAADSEESLAAFQQRVGKLQFDHLQLSTLGQIQIDLERIVAQIRLREARREKILDILASLVDEYGKAEISSPLIDQCIDLVTMWHESNSLMRLTEIELALREAVLFFETERTIRSKRTLAAKAIERENYAQAGALSGELTKMVSKRHEIAQVLQGSLDRLSGVALDPDDGNGNSGGTAGGERADSTLSRPDPGAQSSVGATGKDLQNRELDTHAEEFAKGGGIGATQPDPETTPEGVDEISESGSRDVAPDRADAPPAELQDPAMSPVIRAILENRLGVADFLARQGAGVLPGSGAIRLVAANHVSDPEDAIEADLPGIAAEAIDQFDRRIVGADSSVHAADQRMVAVLLASASLLPALKAPGGPVVAILSRTESLLEGCHSLRALVRVSAETLGSTDLPLSPDSLSQDWDRRRTDLKKEAVRWIEAERNATLPYAPATEIWHHLLERWHANGKSSIGEMFWLLTVSRGANAAEKAQELAEFWRENADREMDRLHQARHGQAHSRIDGRARVRLREKIAEAAAHADRWTACLAERPEGTERYQQPIAQALQDAADAHGEHAVSEVEREGGALGPVCAGLVERYLRAVRGGSRESDAPNLRLQDLLEGDFLPWTRFSAPPTAEEALSVLDAPRPDLKEAVSGSIDAGEFARAESILEYAHRRELLGEAEIEGLRALIDGRKAKADEDYERRFGEIENRVQEAEAQEAINGEAGEAMRSTLLASIETGTDLHNQRMTQLEQVASDVDREVRRCRREIRKAFRAIRHPPARTAHQLEKAVRENRFRDARRLLGQVQDGTEGG